jgi:hypothetical protein
MPPNNPIYRGWWLNRPNSSLDLYVGFGGASDPVEVFQTSTTGLLFAGTRTLRMGTSGSPLTVTTGSPYLTAYTTSSSTTGTSVEPVLFNHVMTGAGGVGGRVAIRMETNVALGGWANALRVLVDRKTNGRATGLMSVINAEMVFPASSIGAGTTCIYECEIVMPTSFVGDGSPISVMYIEASGATKAQFDTNGFLFDIAGVTAGSEKFWDTSASAAAGDNTIRIRVNGATKYILVADDNN